MGKSYYEILGVEPDATPEEIRSAFRRQAKLLHPDHCEGGDREPFLEARQAYETLSDPGCRRAYDERCRRAEAATVYRAGRPAVETVWPDQEFVGFRRGGGLRFSSYGGSIGTVLDMLLRSLDPFSEPRVRGGEEELQVEVTLTWAEARRGGRAKLSLPARQRCPECGGRGRRGAWWCATCEGEGTVVVGMPVEVSLPAGVPDGYTMVGVAELPGVRPFRVVVRFRVE